MPWEVDRALQNFGLAMGPFRWATSPAWTSAGHRASAARPKPADAAADRRRQAVRARPLRPEDGRRLVPLRAGERDADPDPVVEALITEYAPRSASRRARSATRRSSSAACTRWSTKARRILEEGIARARQRHRRGLAQRLRLPGVARRPDVLGRQRGPAQRRACAAPFRCRARGRPLLAAGAAAGAAGGGRGGLGLSPTVRSSQCAMQTLPNCVPLCR